MGGEKEEREREREREGKEKIKYNRSSFLLSAFVQNKIESIADEDNKEDISKNLIALRRFLLIPSFRS